MELTDEVARRAIAALHRPWWKPADPFLLTMLLERNAAQNIRLVRFGIVAAAFVNSLFCFLDYLLLPDVASTLIMVRIGVGLFFVATVELVARTSRSLSLIHVSAATGIIVAAVGWLIPALQSSQQVTLSQFMVFGTIFVLGANLFFNFRFWLSALSSVTVTIAFVYGLLFSLDINETARGVLSLYFVSVLALSLYFSWQLSLERYNSFLHSLQAQIQEKVAIEKGQQLEKIAETDPLTGLRNRRAISQDFLNLTRNGLAENEQIGLILIDVDYFKRFNDSLGHHAGDECLIALARLFSQKAEELGAVAGRHGGEEFVILTKVNTQERLRELADVFCKSVEALAIPHPDRGDDRHIVTISAGAAMTRNDGSMELTVLLQQADRALYSSKFSGRATFTIYDPTEASRDASGENLAELLKHAIARGLVSVVYQPFIDARTSRVIGYETLMRMRDFDGSLISPAVFIPVAEQTGAIHQLGRWAIEQACRDIANHGMSDVVSVNVSAMQLKTPGFPLQVTELICQFGISPKKLALEVTEGIDIALETQAQKNIEQLRAFGVQVWLDDFGTGFAGLAWLRRFDFDVVKIDRAFLHDCESTRGSCMLQDIVRLLRNRGVHVLVEGVETKQQVELLKRLGVNTMQGYYLGRPAPLEAILVHRAASQRA
ncbi:putative bifunctional diguanylate cyclase/phosphodiesterase [Rhizobium sp. C4]|uniref:putative bifunctional diguanylate cyclase/phosphodiesterase n=1 Tax=Rhizobium sp. C4 TaxID=1349800 RepID=UPI001E34E809|nr:bifunctional diguanylate cyclase/phosphodiesterase [Rhizobium sp. C4]MCD2173877.1 bifunctional diguanylate cyclase/phosphodiesterase [Rhizobium sp. C4]